jgi:hypothetical protein
VYVSVKVLTRSGSATVRHCKARGSKFLVGLEFSELLNPDVKRPVTRADMY